MIPSLFTPPFRRLKKLGLAFLLNSQIPMADYLFLEEGLAQYDRLLWGPFIMTNVGYNIILAASH